MTDIKFKQEFGIAYDGRPHICEFVESIDSKRHDDELWRNFIPTTNLSAKEFADEILETANGDDVFNAIDTLMKECNTNTITHVYKYVSLSWQDAEETKTIFLVNITKVNADITVLVTKTVMVLEMEDSDDEI